MTVWDRNDNVMPNGTGLFGGPTTSSVHQALIAPDPAGPGLYYIITNDEYTTGVDAEGGDLGFHYSKVDMSLNGGLGDVTEKNIYLTNSINETFAGGVHANGTDSWIAVPRSNHSGLKMFHIGPTGIAPFVNNTFPNRFNSFRPIFFHSGKRLIVGTISQNPVNVYLRIMNFDNETGALSDPIDIFHAGGTGLRTMEISPDDSKLYTVFNDTLYQHDLSLTTEAAINASRTVIGAGYSGEMRTAPDGKIYQSAFVPGLRRIHAPNLPGGLCDYEPQPLSVAPGLCRLGLPLNVRGPRYSGAVELGHPATTCVGSVPLVEIIAPDPDCAYTWFVNDSLVQADPGDTTLHVPYTSAEGVLVR
ncbi:MAG: hypothetical protein IPN62_03675 [Flavobacteriales bacterium]|nr:hypothetical protein [Flavobacteriales bacterium]